MDVKAGELRIWTGPSDERVARDAVEREMLVDLVLVKPHPQRTIALRFEADDDRGRSWGDHGRRGFLLVGVHDNIGAAVLHTIKDSNLGDFEITATRGESASAGPSAVILDDSASMYFLERHIVPKDQLRAVMAEYALTGAVAESAPMTHFDWHTDHHQVDFPAEVPPGFVWPAPGAPGAGEPPF